ncbi:Wzz/FepE/Etk N-terminal domain-containing protein [Negadavirga shengliensis]|uniref:Wzz/FepE/Etk N-terminal domain-containing protein n=1 Tax=Negadavirga shengliensis TaxID=1389218 RepID=A0ABV9T2D6_9BACT
MLELKKVLSYVKNQDSLDLNILFFMLWKLKLYFSIVIVLILLVGIVVFFVQNKEYESTSEILLESSPRGSFGQLGNLANMAGLNLPVQNDNNLQIDPDLYEKIILSHSFIFELTRFKFFSKMFEREVSLEEFFILEKNNGSLPESFSKNLELESSTADPNIFDILDDLEENELREYNSYQSYAINQIKSRIAIKVENQLLTFTVKMPEPEIAARLNIVILNKLKDFLIAYKTEKMSRNVQFIEERKLEAEKKYKDAQKNLAQFRDQNQGVISQTVRTNEENLQSEVNLSFNILTALSQNFEQSQIQLKKETPVFFYIENPVVSKRHSEPKFVRYFFIYLGLGIILNGIILFGIIIYIYLNKLTFRYGK